MKILGVVGTRPNFVKIAPLLAEMRSYPDVEPWLVHTGQHYDPEMADCFLRDLDISPQDVILRNPAVSPGAQRKEMTEALRQVMLGRRPDGVVVVGDVTSTVAAAVAAADLGIPVAHVEAGLRSFDRSMPEEINRIVTDSVSTLLFASEPSAVRNLTAEGHSRDHIFLVGNVMIDTLKRFLAAAERSTILSRLDLLSAKGLPKKYVLVTLHRPATVDDPAVFARVWEALEAIALRLPVIFPVHPRTQARLRDPEIYASRQATREKGGQAGTTGVRLVRPLPYLDFVRLERSAALVMTDSGGVQEETTALGVPCLTLRNNTERPITLTEGTNQIVGLEPVRIEQAAHRILSGRFKLGRIPSLWDGHSAPRIVRILHQHFGAGMQPRYLPILPNLPAPAAAPDLDAVLPALSSCRAS
ncbi:MAG TPA: UDP-N-acetylglucosamine 2-epimerase (non-hydrolyzing) [Terriglobia bacterium]